MQRPRRQSRRAGDRALDHQPRAGLGVTITAEGVETEAELRCLRAEGCHEGQGYLFSRARPNAEIVKLLQAQCDADCTATRRCEAALVA